MSNGDQLPFWKWCPPKYRFLFQAVGTHSPAEAVAEVERIFGRKDAFVVQGTYLPDDRNFSGGTSWTFRPEGGYMAFVPKRLDSEAGSG